MPGHLRLAAPAPPSPASPAMARAAGGCRISPPRSRRACSATGEGRTALDLCAAPGGKTMQLAAAGFEVTAVDASESRLARLSENLARTGLSAEGRRRRHPDMVAARPGRRDPARRALLGDRHLPPPSRRPPPRPPARHRRARRGAEGDARPRRRLAEARRHPGLFGLLAGAARKARRSPTASSPQRGDYRARPERAAPSLPRPPPDGRRAARDGFFIARFTPRRLNNRG